MQEMYYRLSEKNRRLYAGVEALKLSYGGISYISRLFGCARDTVLQGIKELNGMKYCLKTGIEMRVEAEHPCWKKVLVLTNAKILFANWYFIHQAITINSMNLSLLDELNNYTITQLSTGSMSKQDVLSE